MKVQINNKTITEWGRVGYAELLRPAREWNCAE
jgi:hypothetical protein